MQQCDLFDLFSTPWEVPESLRTGKSDRKVRAPARGAPQMRNLE